jgi:hypothetical protein
MDVTTGNKVLVTYAYDGSGIALRARATVVYTTADDDKLVVALDGDNADALKALTNGHCAYATVTRDDLSAPGSYAKVASFGWLD